MNSMKRNSLIVILIASASCAWGQAFRTDEPLAHTFSIVARDERTGEMAVAVQSHWFSVGTLVCWGEAGVGVVATQSFVNKSFGLRGLDLLRAGNTPEQVLQSLLENDPGKEVRQVAILDVNGRVAAFTGKNCIASAGHKTGKDFSVQANMMANDRVVPAMESAWLANKQLPLAERLIAVLKAAQSAGGDIRGKQSAALLIVRGEATSQPWDDRLIDLRVDDASDPIKELDRLLAVYRAYEHMNLGDLYVEKGNMKSAMDEYHAAMKMFPENLEMQYWTAIALATNGEHDKAVAMLQDIYRKDPNWRELTSRLPKVGLLTVSEKELGELTK
jgi:uncharacterized Ntn-hydrolase superfamily protein